MDKMNSDSSKKAHYQHGQNLAPNTGPGHRECFLMRVDTAHSFGFQGLGFSCRADHTLRLICRRRFCPTFVTVAWRFCPAFVTVARRFRHCRPALIFTFVLWHSLAIPPLMPHLSLFFGPCPPSLPLFGAYFFTFVNGIPTTNAICFMHIIPHMEYTV